MLLPEILAMDPSMGTRLDGPPNTEPEASHDIGPAMGVNDWQASPEQVHQCLCKLIKSHHQKLQSSKAMLTNCAAAGTLMDLEAIDQYNDIFLCLSQKRTKLVTNLPSASTTIAAYCPHGPHYAWTIWDMVAHLLRTGLLPELNQGKGAKHESLLNRTEISSALQAWVKGVLLFEKEDLMAVWVLNMKNRNSVISYNLTSLQMRPPKLHHYVNEFLLPDLKIEVTISELTTVQWLKKLGFNLHWVQKGVYIDGHECADVVIAYQELINHMYTDILP